MSVLVIAEIGVNHNGSMHTAHQLIDAAVSAGADVCKFQLFGKEYADGKYENLRLSRENIKILESYCKQLGVKFACTAFDADNLQWLLDNTDMAFVKAASGKFNRELVKSLGNDLKMPVFISTGGCTEREIQEIRSAAPKYKYLHCVSEYPTPPEHANLNRAGKFRGLSDHSGDIFIPLAAVALGAQIIECHITLDKNQPGPDHKASLTPEQFKEMVRGTRAIEKGLQ
jgi:N,N'-diacetyllegionaminate synthase